MSLDLYQQETANLARHKSMLLNEARQSLLTGKKLTPLEEEGVLHALQILIENAIGKTKHILKSADEPIPTSAYDSVQALARIGQLQQEQLSEWNAIIGLRNRIVYEYMNLDIGKVLTLVEQQKYQIIVDFLLAPIER